MKILFLAGLLSLLFCAHFAMGAKQVYLSSVRIVPCNELLKGEQDQEILDWIKSITESEEDPQLIFTNFLNYINGIGTGSQLVIIGKFFEIRPSLDIMPRFSVALRKDVQQYILSRPFGVKILKHFLNEKKRLPDPAKPNEQFLVRTVQTLILNPEKRARLQLDEETEKLFLPENFKYAYRTWHQQLLNARTKKERETLRKEEIAQRERSKKVRAFETRFQSADHFLLSEEKLSVEDRAFLSQLPLRNQLSADFKAAADLLVFGNQNLFRAALEDFIKTMKRLPLIANAEEKELAQAMADRVYHVQLAPQKLSNYLNRLLRRSFPDRALLAEAEETPESAPITLESLAASDDSTRDVMVPLFDESSAQEELRTRLSSAMREKRKLLFIGTLKESGKHLKGTFIRYDENAKRLDLQLHSSGNGEKIVHFEVDIDAIDPFSADLISVVDPEERPEVSLPLLSQEFDSKFRIELSSATAGLLRDLKAGLPVTDFNGREGEIAEKIQKTLTFLGSNPRHPGLNSHSSKSGISATGERIFISYLEHNRPGAGRIFWSFAGERAIFIHGISPHPNDDVGGMRYNRALQLNKN